MICSTFVLKWLIAEICNNILTLCNNYKITNVLFQ